jgi:MFS family permease
VASLRCCSVRFAEDYDPFGLHLTTIASYVADYFGRRVGVAIGLVILFVGTIIQAVPTVNDDMFIAGRFLVGLGYVPNYFTPLQRTADN